MKALSWACALLCLTACTSLPITQEGVQEVLVQEEGAPLDEKALETEMKREDDADKRRVSMLNIEERNTVRTASRVENESGYKSKEDAAVSKANEEVAAVQAAGASKLKGVTAEADADEVVEKNKSLDKFRVARRAAQAQESEDKTEAVQERGRAELNAISRWELARRNARIDEDKSYKRADNAEARETLEAKQERNREIEQAKSDASRTKNEAVRKKAEDDTEANRDSSRKKAEAAQVKANALRGIREATGDVALDTAAADQAAAEQAVAPSTFLQLEAPTSALDSSAQEQQAVAEAATQKAAVDAEKQKLDQKEQTGNLDAGVASADDAEKRENDAADAALKQMEITAQKKRTQQVTAAENLATQKTADANNILAKGEAIARGTEGSLKSAATKSRNKADGDALAKRQKAQKGARTELNAAIKTAEANAAQQTANAKEAYETTVKQNQAEWERAKANAETEEEAVVKKATEEHTKANMKAAETKAAKFERLAAGGAVSGAEVLLQESGAGDGEQSGEETASMSSAELAKVQEEEKKADAKAANDMIFDSTKNTDDVIQAKKEGDISKAETDAVNQAEEASRKAKASATAQELKDFQDADDDYLTAVELANKRFRTAKEEIDKEAGEAKIRATEAKDRTYSESTAEWEKSKEQARKVELEKFRKVEEQDGEAIAKAKTELDAAVKAIKADHAQKLAAAAQKRKEEYAAANQKNEAERARILKKKQVQVEQLSAERAKEDQEEKPAIPAPAAQSTTATSTAAAAAAAVSAEAAQAASAAASTPGALSAVTGAQPDPQ